MTSLQRTSRDLAKVRRRYFKYRCFGFLAYVIIKGINLTCRHRFVAHEHVGRTARAHPSGAMAFAFWHEHSVAGFMSQQNRKIAPMVSESPDGEIAAFVARHLGMHPVRGSSTYNGRRACHDYVPLIGKGYTVALTVDGPTGPRHDTKPGIIHLASQHHMAILPFIAKADRYWTLPTWDQMKVPKPFSRIVTMWGEPIPIPDEIDPDDVARYRALVTERLLQL